MGLRRHHLLAAFAAFALLALLAAAGPAAAKDHRKGSEAGPRAAIAGFVLDHWRYRPIEPPGAVTMTLAFGIDNRGRIVGGYDDADGRTHGFLREKNGRYRTIDVPGAYATFATRINDRGQIAGDYFETKEKFDQGLKRGFLLDRGRFRRIDVPGADSTEAVGLDNRGRVVGEAFTLDPLDARGYLWDDGRIKRIDVPGAAFTGAEEINERGQIAGTYGNDPAQVVTRGYLLDGGRFTTFAAPGGPVTQVFGLNNRGQIAGYVAADELLNDAHGFLLPKGVGGPFTPIDFPGAPRTIAIGINDRGAIVGAYDNPRAAMTARRGAGDAAGWAAARWVSHRGVPR
jgi:uncharacterized membrane protein